MDGKIYVTGDTHRQFNKFNITRFPWQETLDKDDDVIICGDFGLIWNDIPKDLLDYLETRPFTVLFVDGNHENFDRLSQYPVEEWHGGKVHKIGSSVIYLMRGQYGRKDRYHSYSGSIWDLF